MINFGVSASVGSHRLPLSPPAGTPLGDPIEVGAANAVLLEGQGSRRTPLALLASKSWLGHAEPAAGMVGIAHAALASTHLSTLGVSNLRQLNPYVVSSMKYSGVCLPPLPHASLFVVGFEMPNS